MMNKMVRRLLCAIVVGVCGCTLPQETTAPVGDLTIFVQSPEIMTEAEEAASEWNACGKRQIILVTEPIAGSIPLRATNETLYSNGAVCQGRTDFTNAPDDKAVAIAIEFNPIVPFVRLIIAHEMGHALIGRVNPHFGNGLMKAVGSDPDLHVSQAECDRIKD